MYGYRKTGIFLPIIFLLFIGGGILICYGVGKSRGRFFEWPYVSDTGSQGPEGCLFGLFLAFGAIFGFATMHLYYKYVIACDQDTKLNQAAWWVGMVACLGIIPTGTIRWNIWLEVHLAAASVVFVGAAVYCWLIVVIAWRQLVPHAHGKMIVYLRGILTLMTTLCVLGFLSSVGFGLFVDTQVDPGNHWAWATIVEWIAIYLIVITLSTLAYDLRNVVEFKTEVVISHPLTRPAHPIAKVSTQIDVSV